MDKNAIAEAVSLASTFPCICMCTLVVYLWWKPSVKAFKILHSKQWWLDKLEDRHTLGHCWFVLGVSIGFVGGTGDNSYWFIPWSFAFVESEQTGVWMEMGVFFNIPFRQMAGTVSAYCHVRSAICHNLPGISVGRLHNYFAASCVFGILYVYVLYFWIR